MKLMYSIIHRIFSCCRNCKKVFFAILIEFLRAVACYASLTPNWTKRINFELIFYLKSGNLINWKNSLDQIIVNNFNFTISESPKSPSNLHTKFQSFCLSVFLSFSVAVSFCCTVFLSQCRSVPLSFCRSDFLSFCLSVILSFCLSVFLSSCLHVFMSFCLSVFMSFCLFKNFLVVLQVQI
jgi:hypothetical protein